MEIYGDTPGEARRNIRHSDKARSAYYRHISGKRWGDGKNYQLVLDSSVGIDKAVETIVNYISPHQGRHRRRSYPVLGAVFKSILLGFDTSTQQREGILNRRFIHFGAV